MLKTYAAISKNKEIINDSSSGGAFYSIASHYLNCGNCSIYGAAFDESNVVKHIRVTSLSELKRLQGSKYVRSEMGTSFNDCKSDLKMGIIVVFSGTPCQINSLIYFLDSQKVSRDKLITIDIICHGTSEPKYWKKYVEFNKLENVNNINFRYKKPSYKTFSFKGGDILELADDNQYMNAFLNNKILCDSCYNCQTKGENRKSDVTIGDFWGEENFGLSLDTKNGVSLVVLRNKKLLNILKETCFIQQVPYYDSLKCNSAYFYSMNIESKCEVEFSRSYTVNAFKKHPSFIKLTKAYLKKKLYYQPFLYQDRTKRKRKEVCIITEFGYYNFGNRLQNFALTQFIKNYGFKVISIRFVDLKETKFFYFLKKILKKPIIVDLYKKYSKEPIEMCDKRYNNIIPYYRCKKDERRLSKMSAIVVGSDQIWNPTYHNDLSNMLAQVYINNYQGKKISYAASMCVDKLDDITKLHFETELNNFSSISVREPAAISALSEIGFKPELVCDPTLLLNREEWDDNIERFKTQPLPSNPYVLVYGLATDIDVSKYKDKTIVFMSANEKYNQFDFVNYIKHSDLVITDSYHGLLFSVIYKKKIVLVKRGSNPVMLNRFENIIGFIKDFDFDKEIELSDSLKASELTVFISQSKKYLSDSLK